MILDMLNSIPVLVPALELPSGRFAHCFQFLSGGQLSKTDMKFLPIMTHP